MVDSELLESFRSRLELSDGALGKLQSAYEECCAILQQDEASASALVQDPAGNGEVWRVCILWLLKNMPGALGPRPVGAEDASGNGLPLSELLNDVGSNLVAFFKEVPVVLAKLKPYFLASNPGMENLEGALKLREWQETLVSLTILAKKYKELLWRFYKPTTPSQKSVMQAGWLMFLVLKAQLLPGFPDLVSCLQLLVCSVNLLVASMPLQPQEVRQLQAEMPLAIDANSKFNTLKALSQAAKIDYPSSKALMSRVEMQARLLLVQGQFSWLLSPLPEDMPHPQAAVLDVGCQLHVPGMVTGKQQLQELVMFLDSTYQKTYQQQGEIDEREFLVTDFGALASPRTMPGNQHLPVSLALAGRPPLAPPSAAPSNPVASPAASGASAATAAVVGPAAGGRPLAARKLAPLGLQSPLPIMHLGPPGPATPVTQTMGSVSWLRALTKDLPTGPPPSLCRILDAAGPEARQALCQKVEQAGTAVFGRAAGAGKGGAAVGGASELQDAVAEERREEGIKLYWHVLEAILAAEEGSKGLAGTLPLVTRWSFHQCLLACSFEMVAASYRMGLLTFPSIPTKLRLKPFDLGKMVGAFVAAEPTLPRELKRHLFTIEEKILESLAWQPGSSIYKLLELATTDPKELAGRQSKVAAAAAAAAAAGGGGRAAAASAGGGAEAGGSAPGPASSSERSDMVMDQPAAAAGAAGAAEVQSEGNPLGGSSEQGAAAGTAAAAADQEDTPMGEAGAKQEQEQQQQQQGPATAEKLEDGVAKTLQPTGAAEGTGAQGTRRRREEAEPPAAAAAAVAAAAPQGAAPMETDRSASPAAAVAGPAAAAACSAGGGSGTTGTASPPAAGSAPKRHKAADGSVSEDPQQQQAAARAAAAAAAAQFPLPKAIGSPPGMEGWVPTGGDPSARAVVLEYCRKVLKLAAFRLVAISEGLDFSPMPRDDVLAAVHEVVTHALYHHTSLFYGRHLDQVLLASLYGYCKVNRLPQITFREIISHYRRQAHAKQEVFRTVVLEATDPGLVTTATGDIIAFYNQVFVPRMKAFLLNPDPSLSGQDSQGPGQAPRLPSGDPSNGSRSTGGDISPTPGPRGLARGSGSSSGKPPAGGSSGQRDQAAMLLASKSPIFAALQHHAAQQQQQQMGLAGTEGSSHGSFGNGLLGRRTPTGLGGSGGLQAAAAGSHVYRTLSLDSSSSGGGMLGPLGSINPASAAASMAGDAAIGSTHLQDLMGAAAIMGLSAGSSSMLGPAAAGAAGGAGSSSHQQQQRFAGQQAGGGKTPVQAGGAKAYVPSRLGRPSPSPTPDRVGIGAGAGGYGGVKPPVGPGRLQQQGGVSMMYGGGGVGQLMDGRGGFGGGKADAAADHRDSGMDQDHHGSAVLTAAAAAAAGGPHGSGSSNPAFAAAGSTKGGPPAGSGAAPGSGGELANGEKAAALGRAAAAGGLGGSSVKCMPAGAAGPARMHGGVPSGLVTLLQALDTEGAMDQSGGPAGAAGLAGREAAAGVGTSV